MATTLDARGIRLFDYPQQFAEPLRDAIRAHAERVAADAGIEVEYIKKPTTHRREDRIRQIVAKRGSHPGLVHVFSVMELCSSYRPWHEERTGLTHLRPDHGKCVYYFYFIDEVLGPCFLSVPTWCPFRAQFYLNGHNWLASKLKSEGCHSRSGTTPSSRSATGGRHRIYPTTWPSPSCMLGSMPPSHDTSLILRRSAVTLEHRPGRVRHRYRLPQRRRPRAALRSSAQNIDSRHQGRRHRHVPWPLAGYSSEP